MQHLAAQHIRKSLEEGLDEKGCQQREEFEALLNSVIGGDPLEFHLPQMMEMEWIVLAVRRRDGGSWTLIPRKGWNFWKGNRCDESYFDGFFIGHEEYKKGRNLRVAVVDKFGKATLRDGVLAVSEKGMISPGVQPEKVAEVPFEIVASCHSPDRVACGFRRHCISPWVRQTGAKLF